MGDPLSTVASLIAIIQLSSSAVTYLRSVKNASQDCKRLESEIISTRGFLETLQETLNDITTDTIKALEAPAGPLMNLRDALSDLNSILGKSASATGMKKLAKSLVWPFTKSKTEDMVRIIERQKSLLALALDNNHLLLTKSINDNITATRRDLGALHSNMDGIGKRLQLLELTSGGENLQKILSWLSPLEFIGSHNEISENRQAQTGAWLLNSVEYHDWLSGPRRTLFCVGIPGSGKTYLVSLIIDELRAKMSSSSSNGTMGLGFVYCNYTQRASQSKSNLMCSLLRQLVEGHLGIIQELSEYRRSDHAPLSNATSLILEFYNAHDKGKTPLRLVECTKVLKLVAEQYDQLFLVVDALDEFADETRDDFIRELQQLPEVCRLLVTCRPIPSIEEQFRHYLRKVIKAQVEDLEAYISSRLTWERKLARMVALDNELQTLIKNELTKKSDGMFLMVKLHMDDIAQKAKFSKSNVKKAIYDLPTGLDRTYENIIDRISRQGKDEAALAMQVLSWVCLCYKPLSIRQLQQAIAIGQNESELDQDVLIDPEYILSVCAGLVVLDTKPSSVRLVHFSTADFFRRHRDKYLPDATACVSRTCLTHLKAITEPGDQSVGYILIYVSPHIPHYYFDVISEHYVPLQKEYLRTHPFAIYTLQYSTQHLQDHLLNQEDLALFQDAKDILTMENRLESMRKAYKYLQNAFRWEGQILMRYDISDKRPLHSKEPKGFEPYPRLTDLQFATYMGVASEVAECLKWLGPKINQARQDSPLEEFTLALFFAAVRAVKLKSPAAFQTFLDAGCSVDSRDAEGETPLHYAIRVNSIETVQFLLDRGCGIEERNKKFETPLHLAASLWFKDMISCLLTRGAHVNARTMDNQTPLHIAAKSSEYKEMDISVLRCLLEHGSEVRVHDDEGRTPIMLAQESRNKYAVRLLESYSAIKTF